MTEREIRDMRELDGLADKTGGLFTDLGNNEVHYNYRKINEYCRKKGIEPIDITIRELDNFVIGNNDEQKAQPLDCCLPKVIEYMKKTGKSFDELTDEERAKCK